MVQNYGADSIQVVEGLEHVRLRPGMYIGGTGLRGLHHLIWEIVDNAVDEAMNGYATAITVSMNADGSITVEDNGRGIPVAPHPVKKIPAVRLVYEVLGAGGKFDGKNYKTSGGLHGVGASVVNALSKWLEIEIRRDAKVYRLRYENQKLVRDVKSVGVCNIDETGTKVTFMPDATIFETIDFKHDTIRNRVRELAFLNKGISFVLNNQHTDKQDTFLYDGGLTEFVKFINSGKDAVNAQVITITGEKDGIEVEAALQYTTGFTDNLHSFVNNIHTIEGGTHEAGFSAALTRALNEHIKQVNEQKQKGKKEVSLQGEDCMKGLSVALSVRMQGAQFEGQTKTKLGNPEVKGTVQTIIYQGVLEFLGKNKKASKDILEKVLSSFDEREAVRAARELVRKQNKLNSSSIVTVGKLANCSSKDPNEREIWIVEGDSAGGSAKQGRDRKTQAILPLKGKPLNVEKKSMKDILENDEMVSIMKSIDAGTGSECVPKNSKFKRVVIATDADVDGSHIRLILLTFFYRYMRPLIEEGYIYIALPPLYKVENGKKIEYAYSDKELEKAKQKVGRGHKLQRYKGLGEMNPDQLWETTMDPNKRVLIRVGIEDAATADKLFSVFMGSRVEPRKEYLKDYL